MRYLEGGGFYRVQNGSVLEQYDTDGGERMVVVRADVPGGSVLPVRVYRGGKDRAKPVVEEARVNGGEAVVTSREVVLTLRARDEGAGAERPGSAAEDVYLAVGLLVRQASDEAALARTLISDQRASTD